VRRIFLSLPSRVFAAALAISLLTVPARSQDENWKHGLSLMGEPKYPAGFKHFDYVNPDAPKGGFVRFGQDGTFDSFNFILPRGTAAAGITNLYDTLMTSSLDEVATEYGLLAEAVRHPPDFSTVTYRLRKEARWHDGKPVTPEDVVWTFENLKKLSPNYRFYYRHVTKAEQTGEREVTFTFDQPGNRELPQIVGQLFVLPKHWWTGTDAQGNARNIDAATLEAPLGSGPYRIKTFTAGRTVSYERVKDYWAAKIPTRIGTENFDELRYEYFRDETVELEAFKAGHFDFRVESSARSWATAYDFPARSEGRVVLEKFPERARGVMQAFVPNLRREKFQDARVRLALNYALDFEDMNRTLFYDQYTRIESFFSGTELASSGLPQGRELEILETVRGKVPEEVFTTDFKNPVGGTEDARRNNLRQATRLLREAGYEIRDKRLVNARTGEPFEIEFLLVSPAFERVVLFYKPALERLGIAVSARVVDSSQYQNRVRAREFDMIIAGWGQSLSPGNEQLDFWGSEAADSEASRNYAGIKNPAVDELIKKVIFATNREELIAATHALDRVLMWNHYVVPTWTIDVTRTARWDRYDRPKKLPEYSFGFPDIWWFDAKKSEKAGGRP
jgi:microcin C transport system substrate-binding protein